MRFRFPSKAFQQFESERRHTLRLSDQLRIESKSAIGFLLKENTKKAQEHLHEAKRIFAALHTFLKKTPYLYSVGGVNVGTEEYVEAQLLADYLERKPISSMKELNVNHQDYICGLCDMSGELLRYSRKHPDQMLTIQEDLQSLLQTCLELVVTRNGVIRKKLEDLERNERKMEEMVYQWELRHG